MKNLKEKLNPLLYIIACFILVIGTAKTLAVIRDNFEINQKVSAETLDPLPTEIKQNQIRYLIEDGYLSASPLALGIAE